MTDKLESEIKFIESKSEQMRKEILEEATKKAELLSKEVANNLEDLKSLTQKEIQKVKEAAAKSAETGKEVSTSLAGKVVSLEEKFKETLKSIGEKGKVVVEKAREGEVLGHDVSVSNMLQMTKDLMHKGYDKASSGVHVIGGKLHEGYEKLTDKLHNAINQQKL